MLLTNLLLLSIPAAGILGYQYGYKKLNKHINKSSFHLPADYFVGLNFLIEEQPDKAVDIFIKMLEVNADTFETHLALGNLFRRRGEVDRAIRIHQNLIAKPNLNKSQRISALSELGQDYLRAGVLNRAEKLFLELISLHGSIGGSLKHLLSIYQQQKDWEQAILIAKKIQQESRQSMHQAIAHYYCELAEILYNKNQIEQAQRQLKLALNMDTRCVRASLWLGKLAMLNDDYKTAIKYYKQVKNQDADFIPEILVPLAKCFEELKLQGELNRILNKYLEEYPYISIVIFLSKYLNQSQDYNTATDFVIEKIKNHPSLIGLAHLIKMFGENTDEVSQKKMTTLYELLQQLLINKPLYRCVQCGFAAKMLFWLCPQCRNWSTIKPIQDLETE